VKLWLRDVRQIQCTKLLTFTVFLFRCVLHLHEMTAYLFHSIRYFPYYCDVQPGAVKVPLWWELAVDLTSHMCKIDKIANMNKVPMIEHLYYVFLHWLWFYIIWLLWDIVSFHRQYCIFFFYELSHLTSI